MSKTGQEQAGGLLQELPLRIFLPYSWWRKGCPFPKKGDVETYRKALLREIGSLGEDLPQVRLSGILFEGGYLGLLMADDFLELLAGIHQSFAVKQGARISGTLFPGSLDMALLSTYQSEGVGPLFFEVPSLLMRECESFGIPNVMQLLDHTRYLLDSYRYPDWGLELSGDLPGREERAWERIGQEILRYGPAHVRFVRMTRGQGFEACRDVLERAGYRLCRESFYTRAVSPPEELFPTEYLGAGLGAVSRQDGFETENTRDLGRYLNSCKDYRNLLVRVEELPGLSDDTE